MVFNLGEHARKALQANLHLYQALDGEAAVNGLLDVLLFLGAEDRGEGVTTTRCCGAMQVPRTTALRWIGRLAAAGWIEQREDAGDRRVTLLRLAPRASVLLTTWLEGVSQAA